VSAARRVLLVAVLFALGACGADKGPSWVELARLDAHGSPPLGVVPGGARVVSEGGAAWLVAPIAAPGWTPEGAPGRFVATMPVIAVGTPPGEEPHYRLVAGERRFLYVNERTRLAKEPGTFTTQAVEGLRLELALAPGEAAPADAELWACLDVQRASDGLQRVRGRRLSGAGTWLPSGHPREFQLSIPPGSQLSFAFAREPLYGGRELRTAPQTLRVRLDGALLLEEVVVADILGEALLRRTVELPRGGVARARLSFEVEGPLALSSILGAVVGPRVLGSYGARPYAAERPDLVIFLADTFRADNLEAYGSSLGLTPSIDGFARSARIFARAWSTSTHTLPAHSSIFSGVFPHQNGVVDYFHPLPAAVETLAERLAASGYRCGLVSDGVMVSQSHGLAQGFEVADERVESGTLVRVRDFLAADDGRPVFLFVQTYAVHTPYRASPATLARLGDKLRLDRSYDEVMESELMRAAEGLVDVDETPPSSDEAREIASRLRDLYRAGVSELDGVFGGFRGELEQRGLLAHGHLFFTSDHGEAFFEHGRPFHANRVFEEELRVPLLVAGPGFAPGVEERSVSLIDLPPTLLCLAGLTPPAQWLGRSLLAPEERRVIYAFQSNRTMPGSTLAVIDGPRKLIAFDDLESVRAGSLHKAFDLERDPGELESVLPGEAWPAELLRAHQAVLEQLLTPLVTPENLRPDAELLEEMRGMGYTGERPEPNDGPGKKRKDGK
jgi:arylsulfatase A-like enzyme